jgi:hypothetical protein
MTKWTINLVGFLIAARPASAQLDAFTLHSKYGAPLDRETFTVRPGIEMVVDYGSGKQVCRIQLPSGMKIVGTVPPGAITKDQINQVLDEVVPSSIRGKEIGKGMTTMGMTNLVFTEYEHVSVSEVKSNGTGQGITVTFKDATCPKQVVPR